MATEKVIGVDIGNSSTEVALADVADNGTINFIGSGIALLLVSRVQNKIWLELEIPSIKSLIRLI